MAVSASLVQKRLKDLEKEVTCAICKELYTDPKILPCLHCYCKECILELALRKGKSKPFSCPECQQDTTLPEGGVEELQSAFIINRLKSMYLEQQKALSKQAQCEMCQSEAPAESFCKQCDKLVCKNCAHMHTVQVAYFEGHELVSVDQLHKIKDEELTPKPEEVVSKIPNCPVHSEPLNIFCFNCNNHICCDCTVKDHKGHNFELNKVAADNKRKEFLENLKPLRKVEDSLFQKLEEVHYIKNKVEAQGDFVANTIETSFEEFHNILERRKQQLLEEAKRRVRVKIENLEKQEKNLSLASVGVRSVIDYTEQYVTHYCDEEVLSMHTEISQRILDGVEEHNKPRNRLEPVEEADMWTELKYAEDLQQLCQKAKIACPMDYITVTDVPIFSDFNKEIKSELVDTNSEATKSRLRLQCLVKCVPTGAVIEPDIKVKTPGRYQISYTPSVCGRHEFSISAYGKPIPGSPFTTMVYKSPTQLDKPVKVWWDKIYPTSIAVNSVGEVIVATSYEGIKVYNKEGKILRRIKPSQDKACGSQRVAVDNEDNIYFIGDGSNKIGKANKNCDVLLVRDIQVKQRGTGYKDIAVVGDEVMVIESDNDGYIMVYDREVNYIRQITGPHDVALTCLYPDHQRNLYVGDDDCNIQVFSTTGKFIRSFSRPTGLFDIESLHVSGQYVYVTDREREVTFVFTTEMKYVTGFSEFYGCVCVDQVGNLYIGDFKSFVVVCY